MSNEELVVMIQNGQDKEKCMEELYLQNKGIISKVAFKYSGYAEHDDLMQEAFIGMLKAVELWESDKGSNFISYAYTRMCASVQRYICNSGLSVRVPDYQYHRILKYERIISESLLQNPRGLSDIELSAYLDISQMELNQLKKDAQMLKLKSLDEPISLEDDSLTRGDTVADDRNDYEDLNDIIQNEELAQVLWPIVDSLEPMQAKTIRARYQDGLTLVQTAERLDVSKNKVRSSENMALRKLRLSKNTKKLRPFMSDESIYSISCESSGYSQFKNTWISSPERVILIEEAKAERLIE